MKKLALLQKKVHAKTRMKLLARIEKWEAAYKLAEREIEAANERLWAASRAKQRAVQALEHFDSQTNRE